MYGLPITIFRFFTVYGSIGGRPDMALFKFTKAILNGEKIDVYNHGDMKRDFTYIDDLVMGVRLLIDVGAIFKCFRKKQYIKKMKINHQWLHFV